MMTHVLGNALLGLLMLGTSVPLLYVALAPARPIWRGDARLVPAFKVVAPEARSYLAFLLWFVPFFGGLALLGLAAVIGAFVEAKGPIRPLVIVGVALILCGLSLVLVYWFVGVFGRPRFLIPPPYRDQPGSLAQAMERRRRTRRGEPPTDHLVVILDVRPATPDEFEPFWMAQCDEPGCDWFDFADDEAPAADDKAPGADDEVPTADDKAPEEEQARRKAALHTTNVAPEVVRPLG